MLERLVALAGEMNQLMGLDPAIDTTGLTEAELQERVIKEAGLLEKTDEHPTDGEPLTDEAITILGELGITVPWAEDSGGTPVAKKKAKGGKRKAAKAAKKAPAKKAAAAPAKKKAASKKSTEPKYGREHSFCEALKAAGKGGKTVDELSEASNKIYIKKGGKDNAEQAKRLVVRYLKPFVIMGFVTEKGGKHKLA